MKVIYETPNKEYEVKEETDVKWQELFGQDAVYYNAYRKNDNFLIYSGSDLEEVLNWFVKTNIISKDEMKYQIESRK